MSYGLDPADIFRRAEPYIDRILRDEKAADLPMQSPTKFERSSIWLPHRRLASRSGIPFPAGRRGDRI